MPRSPLPRLQEPPTLAQARALEATLEASVEPRFIDLMGHMNVAWYVHLFDRATWALFEAVGIDETYRRQAGAGMFAVEQHVRYQHELREGEALRVTSGVLDVQPKSVHLLHVMVDLARERVAASTEVVGVHIDMTARKAAPLPPAAVEAMRRRLVAV
jgi:acyl-CoA thioester hydrolase